MRSGLDESDIQPSPQLVRPKLRSRSRFLKIGMLLIAALLLTSLISALPFLFDGAPSENAARISASANIPKFRGTYLVDQYPPQGEPLNISVRVFDLDNDTINVTWNWGDGTPNDVNTTAPAASFQEVNQSHMYNPPREPGMGNYYVDYTLNVTLDDGTGNYNWKDFIVHVYMPDNIAPQVKLVELSGNFDPSDSVPISANATDEEGEALTWTFLYNDTVSDFFTEVKISPISLPNELVWMNTTHVFGAEGTYRVRVYVTDRVGVNQFDASHNITGGPVTYTVVANRLPSVSDNISMTSSNPVIIDSVLGYTNITFSITARDKDGEILNVTWDFDDGTPQVYNTSSGGIDVYQFVQWRNYTATGQFNVTVNITDGRPSHEVVRYLLVNVTSTNMPPGLGGFQYNLSKGVYALPNEIIKFTLILTDPEQNPIEVVVDFGDNSPRLYYFNLTDYVDGNITLEFNHSYAVKGEFNITITFTDNRVGLFDHIKSVKVKIKIDVPRVVVQDNWSWWDYTGLGLVCLVPVLIVARMAMISRRRRRLEAEGFTLEEWKLIQSETPGEEQKRGGA